MKGILQAAWVAALVCCSAATVAAPCRSIAVALTILSSASLVKGYLTHEHFVRRASVALRQHLVVIVGLITSILAVTGVCQLILLSATLLAPSADSPNTGLPQAGHVPFSRELESMECSAIAPPVAPSSLDIANFWQAIVGLGCMIVAAFGAHGVAGHVLHRDRWAFFQPFKVRKTTHKLADCSAVQHHTVCARDYNSLSISYMFFWRRFVCRAC